MKSRVGYGANLSQERKREFVARAKTVIDSDQLVELSKVINALAEEEKQDRVIEPRYILIDDLDRNWIDEKIKFRMIRALFEALESFRRIRTTKVLAAVRSDVLERVSLEHSDDTSHQREKFNRYCGKVQWTESELREIVDRRITTLFKDKYTNRQILFSDIFSATVNRVDTFKWIVELTLMRPRDVIAYVNEALSVAEGKSSVSEDDIKHAEKPYSDVRRQALIDEWKVAYPSIEHLLLILQVRPDVQSLMDIAVKDLLENIALEVIANPDGERDPLYTHANRLFDAEGRASSTSLLRFAKEVLSTLYRVGAIGIKLRSDQQIQYAINGPELIQADLIPDDARFRTVLMLHKALNVDQRSRKGR